MSSLCKPGLLSLPVSEQNSSIATDVKVAPGGTENLDPEIYEAVVCQPIMEPQVSSRNRAAFIHLVIALLKAFSSPLGWTHCF